MSAFYGPQLKLNMEFIENELGKSTWFAGDELTGAGILFLVFVADNLDILMSFPVQLSLIRGDTQGMPLERMKAFLKRMEERPAYKRAVEKGGPLGVM
jgi:glutathione S-transferase